MNLNPSLGIPPHASERALHRIGILAETGSKRRSESVVRQQDRIGPGVISKACYDGVTVETVGWPAFLLPVGRTA